MRRREALAAGTLPLAALVPAGDLGGDAELVRLGRELREAWQASQSTWDRCAALVDRIETLPASGVAGLAVKALAISWIHEGLPIDFAVDDQCTTDQRLAATIVERLLVLEGWA